MNMNANMFRPSSVLLRVLPLLLLSAASWSAAADEEGIALGIIYDTSGSMKQSVRDGTGKFSPKYEIARRALEDVMKQLQTFATNAATGLPRTIEAGLFVFNGNNVSELVKFGPFDPSDIQRWTK